MHLTMKGDHIESLWISFAVHCAVVSRACSAEVLIRLGCCWYRCTVVYVTCARKAPCNFPVFYLLFFSMKLYSVLILFIEF